MTPTLRRGLVVTLDLFILFFIVVVLVVVDAGGFTTRVAGIRITAETVWRPALWLAVLLLVRVIVDRRTGPFAQPVSDLARLLGFGERVPSIVIPPLPGWREVLLVTVGLTAAVAFVLREQFADFYLVPDFGDPLFSMWRIGWVAHQVVADPRHLFNANIFYPEPGTLTYSDSVVLPALSVAPLLWLGVPIALVYQILFLAAFILSGTATYLLARGLGMTAGASWIAALFFALCQYRLEHYSHLELQISLWMPLALLAGQRLMATGRARYVVLLAAAMAAQWYSSMYYGVFLTVCVGAFLCALAPAWRAGWSRWAAGMAALLLGVALALPLARVYKSTEAARGTRNADVVQWYSARPSDYFAPNSRSRYYGTLVDTESERELFPHFVPLTLAAIGICPPLTGARLAVLVFGVTAFDGSLGFNGHWYRTAYDMFGPLKSMRVPARFAMLVSLALAVFAGVGAGRLAVRFKSPLAGYVVVSVVTAAFLIETRPILRLRPVWNAPPSLYASLGPGSGAVLFEYPLGRDGLVNNFAYEYFSTWHWTPTVNGYSGFSPRSYGDLVDKTLDFPLGDSVPYLRQRGVTHVALHCRFWYDDACEITMKRLAADQRFTLLASTTWYGKPARLYELAR